MSDLRDWVGQDIPEVMLDDAAAWMAALDSERCTSADRIAFARWLAEDSRHRWAFEELSEVWARLKTLADVEPLLRQDKVVRLPTSISRGGAAADASAPGHDWSAIAAMVIVALGVVSHFLFSTPVESFATAAGESRVVVLNDGSMMELNARTSMDVVIDGQRREVRLTDGEAVFHVAKDNRPFVVSTGVGSVAALGTTFNVEVGDGVLEVAVIEGRVAVTASSGGLPLTEYDSDGRVDFARQSTTLDAGDWLEVSGAGVRQQQVGTEEFRKRLSWRYGIVEFDNEPLQAVIEEMRRYTHVSIHVADSSLSGLRVTGRFETGNVTDFLTQLTEKYSVVVDNRQDNWILLRDPDR
jgi:transmembrane sensor